MDFKKPGDACTKPKSSGDKHDQEEVPFEVERLENEVHNHGASQVETAEETQYVKENEETDNDYLIARDMTRRVINSP